MEKIIRFRNESAFGSGMRDIYEVITYETTELCNKDIFSYCLSHHKLSRNLKKRLRILLSTDEAIPGIWDRNEVEKTIYLLVDELKKECKHPLNEVLWLADKDSVLRFYHGNEPNSEIKGYPVSDVILSDLGPEGTLYAYESIMKSK